ncbi:MAG: DinB family protein [Candidatus Eisenbacteria bacterium]
MARAAGKKPKKQTGERRKRTQGKRATGSRAASTRSTRATGVRRAAAATPRAARKTAKKVAKKAAKPASARVPKRAAKQAATRQRPAPKSSVRKVAGAKRALPKSAVLRKPVGKPVRKPSPRKAPIKPRAASPKRAAVHVPTAFAVQRASADARGMLLFELARARAAVKAAIQGLTGSNALKPIAPHKWSIFEIVLHLSERDRVRLDEFDRTLGGTPHSWAGMHDPEMRPVNEAHLAPLRAHTWDEAVRRLDSLRDELLQRLATVPAEPDRVWKAGHPFADMMGGLPKHDRHHAEQIKHARIGGTSPLEV